MKWSLGLGVRAWAKGIVVRIDSAASEEDFKVQMMVAQPFQFQLVEDWTIETPGWQTVLLRLMT